MNITQIPPDTSTDTTHTYTDNTRCLRVPTDTKRGQQTSTDNNRHCQVLFEYVLQCLLVSVDVCWCLLVSIGILCCLQMSGWCLWRCQGLSGWYSWVSEVLGCHMGALWVPSPCKVEQSHYLKTAPKDHSYHQTLYGDIKITKCPYVSLTKMAGFCHFSLFKCLSERN